MFETLQLALILVPCLFVAIVLHGGAHRWAPLALGSQYLAFAVLSGRG